MVGNDLCVVPYYFFIIFSKILKFTLDCTDVLRYNNTLLCDIMRILYLQIF